MSTGPVFTQKYLEHLMRALASQPRDEKLEHAVEVLCRVLALDNPKFKPAMFICGVLGKTPRGADSGND